MRRTRRHLALGKTSRVAGTLAKCWQCCSQSGMSAWPSALHRRPRPSAWCNDDHHVSFGWLV
jgi:hypothetical protein